MFEREIGRLINLKTEGDYWDFKEKWHSNNADLLIDIMCMANNRQNRDAYIIIGVDNNGELCGVPQDNRKNQQNLIDFLKDKPFAGGVRPSVYVRTLTICEYEIDVIIIENTRNTPYYLTKKYQDVREGNIYTRIVDSNTPKDMTADINITEYLWKKRFGLVESIQQRTDCILNSDGWICEDVNENQTHFFNEFYPEIRIEINEGETTVQRERCTSHDSFYYLYSYALNWNGAGQETLTRKCYNILWYGNKVGSFYTVQASRMNYDFVEPKSTTINSSTGIVLDATILQGIPYAYFIKNSREHMLLKLMFKIHKYRDDDSYQWCFDVLPLFEDEKEHSEFIEYIDKQSDIKEKYENTSIEGMFEGGQAVKDFRIKASVKLGKLLVEMLCDWRMNKKQENADIECESVDTVALGRALRNFIDSAKRGEQTTKCILFGIKYANKLKTTGIIKKIVKKAGLAEGNYSEVQKGKNIAQYVQIMDK